MPLGFTVLRLALVLVAALDAVAALPGTGALPGVAPRMFLAPLVLAAVFLVDPKTEAALWRFSVLVGTAFVGLLLRDALLPPRETFLPAEAALPAGVASALLWAGTMWAVGQWVVFRRYRERSMTRTHDAITGLHDKHYFDTRIKQLLSHSRRRRAETQTVVLYIDLDHFKRVNDVISHQRGDDAIVEFSEFLTNVDEGGASRRPLFRDTDYVCHIGGDEFGVILTDIPDTSLVERVVRRLEERFAEWAAEHWKDLLAEEIEIGMSVGWIVASPGMTPEEVKTAADKRMYEKKNARKAQREAYRARSLGGSR